MNRFKENEELCSVVEKTTELLKSASSEERASIFESINMSILLDCSRSLAIIADALKKDETTI